MPRAALTRHRVVAEARVLAEEVGLDHLTITALAHRLGVRQPSLYKHIVSIADLHRTISALALRELARVVTLAARGLSGDAAIYAMSHAYRDWARRHPSHYEASQRPSAPGDARRDEVMNAVIRAITAGTADGAEHPGERIHGARAARSALHGFITLEASDAFGLGADIDRSFGRTIRALTIALGPLNGHRPSVL